MRKREERALLKQEQLEQERLRLEQERLQERLKQERLDARKAKVESALADKLPAALCLVLMEYTEDAWFQWYLAGLHQVANREAILEVMQTIQNITRFND